MVTSTFIGVEEVREIVGISTSKAYALIHDLNEEFAAKSFMIVSGRVSRQYFFDLLYSNYSTILMQNEINNKWRKSKFNSENLLYELLDDMLDNNKYRYVREVY